MATRPIFVEPLPLAVDEAALAYDAAGDAYLAYADGAPEAGRHRALFDFPGRYGFADREIWQRIDAALVALRASGQQSLRVLDAGCGPGTWLLRIAIRARALGFTRIDGTGVDISPSMIALAERAAADLVDPAVTLSWRTADLIDALSKHGAEHAAQPADIVLCLYGVLNHLPTTRHAEAARALIDATSGSLFVTVRTIGSVPSIFVDGIERARAFRLDRAQDRFTVDLIDGRRLEFGLHLFSGKEFVGLFGGAARVVELVGIDLFHGRFAPDPRWNPESAADPAFDAALARLEHLCAADPAFIDRAAHVLLQATPA